MKRILKVLIDYRHLRVAQYSGFAHGAVAALTTSTYITAGKAWAQPIAEAVAALDAFTEAHPHMNTMLTAELQVLRETLLAALAKAANSVNSDFAGQEAALRSSGFELAAEPQRRTAPLAAGVCDIVDGLSSGSMCLRLKRPRGTMNILWYYTTDPTLPIEQWTQVLELTDELTVTGLVPGTRLHAKVACLNSASTSENLNFAEAKPRYVQ